GIALLEARIDEVIDTPALDALAAEADPVALALEAGAVLPVGDAAAVGAGVHGGLDLPVDDDGAAEEREGEDGGEAEGKRVHEASEILAEEEGGAIARGRERDVGARVAAVLLAVDHL